MSRIDNIYIPEPASLGELAKNLNHSLSKLITQLNNNKITVEPDINNFRIKNVGRPTEMHDAVNVEFLKDMVGKIAIPKRLKDMSGGGQGGYDKLVFGVGIETNLAVANDTNPHYWMPCQEVQLLEVIAGVKVAATGADVIFRIKKEGTSIKSTNFTIPASDTDHHSWTTGFDSVTFNKLDLITIDITQVGSTIAGQTLTVEMKFKIIQV